MLLGVQNPSMKMKTTIMFFAVLALFIALPVHGQELVPGVGFNSALELSPGTYSFHIGSGELHFFKIILEPGDILIVFIRMAANQDFDLYLLNPRRELVGQSIRPIGLTDFVEYVAAERGPHYVVVTVFGGSSGVYSLTVSVQKPRTVTATVTATATERLITTSTAYIFQTQTVVSEKVVTVFQDRAVEVEKVPWTAAGLAVVASALLYTGYAVSTSFRSYGRRGGRPTEQAVGEAAKKDS
jgi:Na+-transporting methylmalonyl-CoA/oxaloacetate decarboxylase beta subunit